MTNKEAIAILQKEYLCVNRNCNIERSCAKCDLMMPNKEPILQAYKIAIKALEQHSKEPKVGEWFFKNEVDRQCSIFTCSFCGEQITLLDDTLKNPQEGHYNFCPNCGCHMVESQENKKVRNK